MPANELPNNLRTMYEQEELLRSKAIVLISDNHDLRLHLEIIESAMNLADIMRKVPSEDEDFKVLRILSIRIFNAFGASMKLALSGYFQNSAMILRDILETTFLLGMFQKDRCAIKRWREATSSKERDEFRPVNVRKFLDHHDGFTGGKRREIYKLFSELAAHPNMKSVHMLRPKIGGDAVGGPYMEFPTLQAVLSEMARLAVQIGEIISEFLPRGVRADTALEADLFARKKVGWINKFYASDK
tara:strand:+ start:750 stop:1481 length:732 start_codon:yes stop_codon:yes gene_type:complete